MAAPASRISAFIHELQRRHVFRIAIGYGVAAFVIAQAADVFLPSLGLPEWTLTFVVVMLLAGFPLALALAWAFDLTPSGVRRTDAASAEDTAVRPQARGRSDPATGAATHRPPSRPAAAALDEAEEPAPPELVFTTPDPLRVERASLAQLRDELRTPANAVVEYSRALLNDTATAGRERLRADLQKIRTAGDLFLSRLHVLLDPENPAWDRDAPDHEAVLSRMRHDLRTPLNAILGYSELILEEQVESVSDDAIAGDLVRIATAARQAMTTIERVVQFAATGRMDSAELARASALAQDVLAKLQPVHTEDTVVPLRLGRLLVVDDHQANRELIGRQLARQGYTVAAAASGREALDMLASDDFDLVLLDILMPEMDGVEVLRRIRTRRELRVIPVVVISALDEVDSVVRCIEMGAADFVTKPFDPVLLGARIGTILELRRLRERHRADVDALRREQEWIDGLLARTFPGALAEKLRLGEASIVEAVDDGTVLAVGVQGSAALARGGPAALLERLSGVYERFDALAAERGIDTVRTAGQCWIAAAGVPSWRTDHPHVVADLALALLDDSARYAETLEEPIRLRIGVHTGSVAVGMFVRARLAFDVWGDAVETAQQLQLHAAAGSIQVSPATYGRLRDTYAFTSRGVIDVVGKGQMRTYLLRGPLTHVEVAPTPGA